MQDITLRKHVIACKATFVVDTHHLGQSQLFQCRRISSVSWIKHCKKDHSTFEEGAGGGGGQGAGLTAKSLKKFCTRKLEEKTYYRTEAQEKKIS